MGNKVDIKAIQVIYSLNKAAKLRTDCKCPSCGTMFTKSHYQQAFCNSKKGTVCKDKYWNTVDPKKRNNTTRISPASKLWLEKQAIKAGFPDHETRKNHVDDFDGSWEEHGCYVGKCEYCKMLPEYCDCDHY